MNLKKIAGMCKTAGSFYVTNIVNDDGEVTDQWVILGPAAYRVGNMGLTANMLARFAGIKDTQLSSYVLKDESQEEMDWMRDYPRSIPSQEVCRATIGLILGGHEIRFYRIVGQSVIVPVNADYGAFLYPFLVIRRPVGRFFIYRGCLSLQNRPRQSVWKSRKTQPERKEQNHAGKNQGAAG